MVGLRAGRTQPLSSSRPAADAKHEGATMNNRIIRHAGTRALVSATLFVVQNSAFTQSEPRVQEPTQMVQFCAPSDHEIGASRIYCRSGVDERSAHHG
jgi:hypothetical protein